jgi:hypothetical protein
MLQKFVERNVREVDGLIAKAKARLEEYERGPERDFENASEAFNRMRLGLARLQVYRSFIEKMN